MSALLVEHRRWCKPAETFTDATRTKQAIVSLQAQLTHYTAGVAGNIEVAREIVQEAFMRFWKTADEKIEIGGEKAWLMRVCRNMAIDTARRAGRVISVGSVESVESFALDESADIRERQNREEALTDILTLLKTLSGDQQEVVRLRYQHDLSYKEISGITGHTVSNVGVLIHDAMNKIKRLLSEQTTRDNTRRAQDEQ